MICKYCDEEIKPGEETAGRIGCNDLHHECFFRMVCGSIAHQQGRCACCGGVESDPPEMTAREAAKASLEYYRKYGPRGCGNLD